MQRRNIRFLYMDNPPANSLSFDTLRRLTQQFNEAMDDEKVDAVVLTGDENYFSAGADLKTLDSNFHKYGSNGATRAYVEAYGTGENIAPFVYALDQARKPVIALIAGVCFGGGLEVALGCHYRVCYENASFRFPEVFVGIVPGSLGTQYLPRLADFKLSIDMAVLGKPVDARTALQSGLVDHVIRFGDVTGKFAELVVQTHLIVGAILNDASGSKPFRRTSSLPVKVSLGDAMVMCFKVSQRLPPVNKGGLAQRATLECLLACVRAGDSFLRGAVWESEVSRAIIASREAQALRYVFLSERAAAYISIPVQLSSNRAGPFKTSVRVSAVGVVGGGLMGLGIAAAFCAAGLTVTLVDVSDELLVKARARLLEILSSVLNKKQQQAGSSPTAESVVGKVTFSTSYASLATADLVVEAVFEDLKVKREVFQRLGAVCGGACVLCSNTSSLSVDDIARDCSHPERIVGMHFFSPAHIMKLVEVVAGAQTSAATLTTVVQVGKRIGKVCVVVRNLPGFVGNRMIFNYALEAMLLLEEGVSVSHIDELLVDFGFPMGVFAMQDMAGLDIGYRVRAEHGLLIQDHASSSRYSRIGDDLYSLGRYGCKTGRGFYKYEEGSRRPIPDNHVAEIIVKRRREEPVPSDTEVLQRLLFPLINEGFKVLEERGVLSGRPGDVDIILVLGYGWPAYKGGALFYAEVIEGLDRVLQGLRTYSARWPECSYFTPSTLLEMMVARKVSVFDIQQDPSKLDGLLAPKPRL